MVNRLQAEADHLGRLLDERTKARLLEREQEHSSPDAQEGSEDKSSDEVWNELSGALINVREELADAGFSREEAEGRAASILKGLGFRSGAIAPCSVNLSPRNDEAPLRLTFPCHSVVECSQRGADFRDAYRRAQRWLEDEGGTRQGLIREASASDAR